ncbi:unnamed protein product [Parascedosporium putredinis]|uniref:MSP domain-containing protein n=1 Tax=Parascedosporium putredinis TaxID=1442378 RepID=A0A9P1H3H9_9PEZI|nr:unnamed protein product [Parascedosporium putredinis]CAI7995871.1 unnamed protein product [Parascedosporium putredinis]
MSVDIEPSELSFRRPFTEEVSQVLILKNPNSSPVAFKVKTTAPKQYCVRPNSGRIEPVLLQAMKADPLDAKCRDKFLVQSVAITPDKEFTAVASVLDSSEKSSIQERKIRVTWLPPSQGANSHASVPAALETPVKSSIAASENFDATPDISRAYASPSNNDDATSSPSPPPQYSDDSRSVKKETVEDTPKTTVGQIKAQIASIAQPTYEELKRKLAEAEATIESLRQDSSLRKRKGGSDNEKIPQTQQLATATRQVAEGVPVKVVAILCFLTFLLSYIFF